MNDEEPLARIWTAQRPIITKLKRNPAATWSPRVESARPPGLTSSSLPSSTPASARSGNAGRDRRPLPENHGHDRRNRTRRRA